MEMSCYREIDFKSAKKIMLNILREFDSFCKNNNLRYSLSFGTLLGAVRHKGMIPWDNDIDVMMPRVDFERFMDEYSCTDGRFVAVCHRTNPTVMTKIGYLSDTFTAKGFPTELQPDIQNHIRIDVYPVDAIPDNKLLQKIQIFKRNTLYNFYRSKIYTVTAQTPFFKKVLVDICKLILLPLSLNTIIELRTGVCTFYNSKNYSEGGALAAEEPMPASFPLKDFYNTIPMLYEGSEYQVIPSYQSFLTKLYGDYMTPPPENQRHVNGEQNVKYFEKKQ